MPVHFSAKPFNALCQSRAVIMEPELVPHNVGMNSQGCIIPYDAPQEKCCDKCFALYWEFPFTFTRNEEGLGPQCEAQSDFAEYIPPDGCYLLRFAGYDTEIIGGHPVYTPCLYEYHGADFAFRLIIEDPNNITLTVGGGFIMSLGPNIALYRFTWSFQNSSLSSSEMCATGGVLGTNLDLHLVPAYQYDSLFQGTCRAGYDISPPVRNWPTDSAVGNGNILIEPAGCDAPCGRPDWKVHYRSGISFDPLCPSQMAGVDSDLLPESGKGINLSWSSCLIPIPDASSSSSSSSSGS